VVRPDLLRVLYRPAILQICRDSGRAKLWQQVEARTPAAGSRRFTILKTCVKGSAAICRRMGIPAKPNAKSGMIPNGIPG